MKIWRKVAQRRGQPESMEVPQKTTQKTTQKILAILRAHPTAGRREIAERLGNISEDGVKYHLDKLKKAGQIRRIGPPRGGRWEIVEGAS